MANAEIYCKWSSQGDGNRGGGAWGGPYGDGAAGGAGHAAASRNHAERSAWTEARRDVFAVGRGPRPVPGDIFQIKIWVDQQICPQCQKWMVIDVLSQVKSLGIRVEVYVEVVFAGVTRRLLVRRSAVWPAQIGGVARYADMPEDYYS